jgi:adenylate cyclase class 2
MPVEAELTATVSDPSRVRAQLADRATVERSTYADTYYDWPDHSLDRNGFELRVRTITTGDTRRVILTYKQPPVDTASRSKPEHETEVDNAAVLYETFIGLGLVELISFEKHCENYRFSAQGRDLLATVVEIPELDGQVFIELETMAEPDDVTGALAVVRAVLADLGITDRDAVTDSYTDMVAAHRAS